jgi:four helix bundle protein
MSYKFEKLEVWQLAMEYVDQIYAIADKLPASEVYNLRSQITRAATSVALNIAEGSTSQSDAEQARFVGYAIRSLVETVACQHLISRRQYLKDTTPLQEAYRFSETLFAKLQALRRRLTADGGR